jgi:ribosomal-protein-alanine N-acetyltransferase
MRLRPFRVSDVETLYRIDQMCFPPGISYSRAELGRFVVHRHSRTWVAEEGNDVVGFLIANRRSDQRVAHIVTIDVLEPWRRRGVGRALMDAAEEWARQQRLQAVALETAEHNATAQKFYAARGYVKYEKLEHYYTDGAAAWVMVKWLEKKSKVEGQKSKQKTCGG